MNFKEGMKRLGVVLRVSGAIVGGYVSFLFLSNVVDQWNLHNRFERLAKSDVVQHEHKSQAGWVSIDPKTGESVDWYQLIDKGWN